MTVVAGKDQSQTVLGATAPCSSGSRTDPARAGIRRPASITSIPNGFALPEIGGFGKSGKGSLRAPGLATWDMGVFKNIPMRENLRLQFRAEFFNVFNRVNYKAPNQTNQTDNVSAGGFGSIRGANDPRIGQLALKILF